jgi:hypothetical protein
MPAAINSTPLSQGLALAIAMVNQPVCSSHQCTSVAVRLNPPQAIK